MILVKFIRENKKEVINSLNKRQFKNSDKIINEIIVFDEKYRKNLDSIQKLRNKRNIISKDLSSIKKNSEESTWKEGKATTPDRRSNSGHGGSDQPDFIGWYIEYAPNPRSMGPSHRETGPFFGFIDEFRGGLWTVAADFPRVSE